MSEFLLRLRHANLILDGLLECLSGPLPFNLASTQDRLARALTEILRIQEDLQQGSDRTGDAQLNSVLQQYRDRLERVRHLMPTLHAHLLTERARLERDRSHLEAASAWADTSKSAT